MLAAIRFGHNERHEMRIILFYVCQILLGFVFIYLTYLPTIVMDFFSWGSSTTDGLYLLFVPFVLLPTILVTSIVKYFVTKGLILDVIYKLSYTISIACGLICTFMIIVDALWPAVIISLLATVTITIETVIVSRQLLGKRI